MVEVLGEGVGEPRVSRGYKKVLPDFCLFESEAV